MLGTKELKSEEIHSTSIQERQKVIDYAQAEEGFLVAQKIAENDTYSTSKARIFSALVQKRLETGEIDKAREIAESIPQDEPRLQIPALLDVTLTYINFGDYAKAKKSIESSQKLIATDYDTNNYNQLIIKEAILTHVNQYGVDTPLPDYSKLFNIDLSAEYSKGIRQIAIAKWHVDQNQPEKAKSVLQDQSDYDSLINEEQGNQPFLDMCKVS